eukprot:CAMPEP_0181398390 /NCGR_PEP_ID=MMETSP1110-20121109/1014_1 /TAXON_ID=174948 /ORGANISM="Symbiodinium sp., Strain CCMP421" /LENGTH=2547 /DNA_ID=CAMNT_0023520335 /DNA_START=24 /DNA_END=7667 /DNA_ORIENTATION=+
MTLWLIWFTLSILQSGDCLTGRRLQLDRPAGPPQKIVVSNESPVPDAWVVHELELFFGFCHEERPLDSFLTNIWSSGTRRENEEGTEAFRAFDGSLQTNWTADCRQVLGGCAPLDAYIGLDVRDTPEYGEAWTNKDEPFNISAPFMENLKVRCIRIFQDSNPLHKSDIISIREVWPDTTTETEGDYVFVTAQVLEAVSAGIWSRRPSIENSAWRIVNLWPTEDPLTLTEVQFFGDDLCSLQIHGAPFSSGSADPITQGEQLALDLNLNSQWRAASCLDGCAAQEAFIGLDFGDEMLEVRCVRMYQYKPNPLAIVSERPSYSRGFDLQRWTGKGWLSTERFWDPAFVSQVSNPEWLPTMITPFFGGAPGVWEDLRPANKTAWRIMNDDWTSAEWHVHELEFFESEACDGQKLEGVALDMVGPSNAHMAALAFDGDPSHNLAWQSHCFGSCIPYEAWLGLYMRPATGSAETYDGPQVRCLRIMQSRFQQHTAASIFLSRYENGRWEGQETHRFIGGGTWNQRPAPQWTQWRILNDGPIIGQWRIHELVAFKDPLCIDPVEGGSPLASGYSVFAEGPERLFDEKENPPWGADCLQCNTSRGYWIGMQLPHDTEDAQAGLSLLRCIKLWQSAQVEQQALGLKAEVWNGRDWTMSTISSSGFLDGGGGGIWSRQPASHMTKWRLRPNLAFDAHWRVEEIEYFADSMCSQPIRTFTSGNGGASLSVSGYTSALAAFDLAGRPPMWSEAELVADGDQATSTLLSHMPSMGHPAWVSVDYLSESVFVRCVRFRQGPLPVQHAFSVQLEIWDGAKWGSDPEMAPEEVTLDGLGGGGWQRRPAAAKTIWRIENLVFVPEGWVVSELEFHLHPSCNASAISGEPTASGFVPPESDYGPHLAFDGNEMTAWVSQCASVHEEDWPLGYEWTGLPVGCSPSRAWIGLDFGARSPQEVQCVRLIQAGYSKMQSVSVALSEWDGKAWVKRMDLSGLGGSSWEQRPAAPNTMWRILHKMQRPSVCRNQLSRINRRSWGVAELTFFSDESCLQAIEGGTAVSSGSIDFYRETVADPPDGYNASNSRDSGGDDSMLTTWGANCNFGWKPTGILGTQDSTRVNCSGAWLGVAFMKKAVEVRCIKLVQSRLESSICCDPASEAELQRWNGSDWIEATWIRDPPPAANPGERVQTERSHLGAQFKSLGECPPVLSDKRIELEVIEEWRTRRDSDNCLIQLTGATSLMGDSVCVTHSACSRNFGDEGHCCPMGDPKFAISRCCCDFISSEQIFNDTESAMENEEDLRIKFNFEYATIWLSNRLPWAGLGITVLAYFSALGLPKDVRERITEWCRRDGPAPRRGLRLWQRRVLATFLWPAVEWRDFLANSESSFARLSRWFVLPNGELPSPLELHRGLLFLLFGFLFAGMAPWMGIGIIAGEGALRGLIGVSVVIRWFKSKYNPLDLRDMALRRKITRVRMKTDEDTADGIDVGMGCAVAFAASLVYFLKFIFDMLILRAQMISMGIIESIEARLIVDIFPGLLELLREPGMLIYQMMDTASQGVSVALTFTIGMPLCEGSCVLVGSVGLVAVLVCAMQWLNYDLFGLFVAARSMSRSTRPECQRIFAQSSIMGMLGLSFAIIQLSMVLFTRALLFANPFQQTVWMCEHDDTLALYMGRTLLFLSALGGIVFVFFAVNGHFMGQDYLLERVGRFLAIDLDGLDPDGTGPGGGMVRCNVFFAAFPTLCGLWLDWWNIEAFLVAERARVYAEVLWDPQPCRTCGKIHTPYDLMMTATGRTISITTQIVPYGALLGKASEYLNDPPFIYWGRKLTCMSASRAPDTPRPQISKKKIVPNLFLYTAEFLTLLIEYVVPVVKRISSVSIYICCLLGTFTLTEKNLVEQGRFVLQTGFMCAAFKGLSAYLLDPLLSFLLGALYRTLEAVEGIQKKKHYIPRTVVGQVIAGGPVAILLTNSASTNRWASFADGLIIGCIAGYVTSMLTLAVNACLERSSPQPGDPPRRAVIPLVIKIGYSLTVGVAVGVVSLRDERTNSFTAFRDILAYRDDKAVVTVRGAVTGIILSAAAQFVSLKMVLLENRPYNEDDGPGNSLRNWRDSPTQRVLRTVRQLGGAVGVPLSGLIGNVLAEAVFGSSTEQSVVSSTVKALFALGVGNFSGIVLALAVNKMLDNPPQLAGFFTFLGVAVLAAEWNPVFGFTAAVVFGCAVGSVFEEFVARSVMRQELLRRDAWNEVDDDFINQAALKQLSYADSEHETFSEYFASQPTRDDNLLIALEAASAKAKTAELLQQARLRRGASDMSEEGLRASAEADEDEAEQPHEARIGTFNSGPQLQDVPDHLAVELDGEVEGSELAPSMGDVSSRSLSHASLRPPEPQPKDSESDEEESPLEKMQLAIQAQLSSRTHTSGPPTSRPDLRQPPQEVGNPGHYEDAALEQDLFHRWERRSRRPADTLPARSQQRINISNLSRPKPKAAPSRLRPVTKAKSVPEKPSLRSLKQSSTFASSMLSQDSLKGQSPVATRRTDGQQLSLMNDPSQASNMRSAPHSPNGEGHEVLEP